jgi:hypothetical protein
MLRRRCVCRRGGRHGSAYCGAAGRAGRPTSSGARPASRSGTGNAARVNGNGDGEVGCFIARRFVPQEEDLKSVYYRSYAGHFSAQANDLDELIAVTGKHRNSYAEATGSVDLQVTAILTYLEQNGLTPEAREVVDIGSWQGRVSHAASVRLSPLHVRLAFDPNGRLAQLWQEKKCLAIWEQP